MVTVILALAACPTLSGAQQQGYRLPDLKSMKHLTTSSSDHASDIPGKETTMDFYSAPSGEIFTVYSYRGKTVAFSTHSNSDIQNTLRVFMDLTGQGIFQEINRSVPWQLPAWVR
ncbi:MAG: hypothetical protein HY912_05170 [Desulfomonile tiedjei]|uniref:Uncharacterized protein n=1 Tax=Desulfomonile tiedjei TaxID=2358 RepID=A0A9D6Z2K9_9BACT|nr:hypothetical protein [Desulfomonile tiedjei]